MPSVRPSSSDIDHQILDVVAGLVARHGPRVTSVQAVAESTGYSKAAIFARFHTKDELLSAAVTQCIALGDAGLLRVQASPPGPERDALAVEVLWDMGLSNPGFIALALASITNLQGSQTQQQLEPMGKSIYAMFDIDLDEPAGVERVMAVTGALSALAVLLMTRHQLTSDEALSRQVAFGVAVSALRSPLSPRA